MGGLLLMALPSFLFGTVAALAPLYLAAAGWGAVAIGATWLCGAACEAMLAPLVGRLVDRRGRRLPVRVTLAAAALLSLGLAGGGRPLLYAPLVVLATVAYGTLFTPAFALIADGAEASGLAQGVGFGLMSAAWAVGGVVGPAIAGATASADGDWLPYRVRCRRLGLALLAVGTGSGRRRSLALERARRLSGPCRVVAADSERTARGVVREGRKVVDEAWPGLDHGRARQRSTASLTWLRARVARTVDIPVERDVRDRVVVADDERSFVLEARDRACKRVGAPRSRWAKASGSVRSRPARRMKRATARSASILFCSKNIHWWTWASETGSTGSSAVPSAR